MKESLLCLLQFALRAAIIAAKNRSGSLQLFFQLFRSIGPRQWLAALAVPILAKARAIAFPARQTATTAQCIAGASGVRGFEQIEEATLSYDVSDETLEAASGMCLRIPTLANTYCFTCPTGADP